MITDAVMPEMDGPAFVEELLGMRPDVRVLFISGYTDDEMFRRGLANPNVAFLGKPFTALELAGKVRGVLEPSQLAADCVA